MNRIERGKHLMTVTPAWMTCSDSGFICAANIVVAIYRGWCDGHVPEQ